MGTGAPGFLPRAAIPAPPAHSENVPEAATAPLRLYTAHTVVPAWLARPGPAQLLSWAQP